MAVLGDASVAASRNHRLWQCIALKVAREPATGTDAAVSRSGPAGCFLLRPLRRATRKRWDLLRLLWPPSGIGKASPMADFFDRLGRTASNVTERSKQWLESAKLRKELDDNQRQRAAALAALGELTYQQLRQEILAAPSLAAHAQAIQELDQRESVLRRQIEALEAPHEGGAAACARCGRSSAPGARFCVGCGASVEVVATLIPACQACGATLKLDARFCPRCGKPIAGAD